MDSSRDPAVATGESGDEVSLKLRRTAKLRLGRHKDIGDMIAKIECRWHSNGFRAKGDHGVFIVLLLNKGATASDPTSPMLSSCYPPGLKESPKKRSGLPVCKYPELLQQEIKNTL
jgi:hypothetical protein